MKEWIFHFSRNALRIPMGVFVRKIHFDGIENFKKGVPVLLACNHPNSFLDGVIFEHFSRRKVYTLARGDAFLKPVTNYIFRGMRLMPIFRATDASAEIARKGNAETKDEIYERFLQNDTVLIFSEGIAYPEKAVRRMKKGTAQIAADCAKKSDFKMDLYVVPTSLNYSKFWTIMQTVHVTYGEPIRVLDYEEMIKEDERSFIDLATNKVKEELEKNVVITKGDHTEEKDFAQQMLIDANYKPLIFKIKDSWKYSIEKLNNMSDQLAEKVKSYKAKLDSFGVLDSNVGDRGFDFLSALIAICTFGISLPFYLIWLLLWIGIDKLVKSKIRNVVFWDSMKVGFMMIISLFMTIGTAVIASKLTNGFIFPIIFTFFSVYGAVCWFRLIESVPHLWKELKWMGMKKGDKDELILMREVILKELDN